jgi:hypothetical protein
MMIGKSYWILLVLYVLISCSGGGCPSESEESGDTETSTTGDVGPATDGTTYIPADCPNAEEDGYAIVDDPNFDSYQIRKVGEVPFSRYERDENGNEILVKENYPVVTALPKRYMLSEVYKDQEFPVQDMGEYYVADSHFALPHIPCVTDDLVYAPVVSGYSEPSVNARGPNLGWPIQEDISDEVEKYQGTNKMWVYTTWPGYRYGYWFRDQVGIRPTWLFEHNDAGGVTFRKFSPDAADWPEGAYSDVPFGLHIDATGHVYVPKPQAIEFPAEEGKAPPPADLKLAYKNWDDELRCVVINKSSDIVAVSRTIWPGGSEAYYPAESFLPGYAVIGEDADRYWGLKGRETDEVSWWAGDDCVDGACSGQSRMPYRNGCAIDGYDFGQGDGFNWLALKDRMIEIGVIIEREQLYRIQIYLQQNPDEPAEMLAELWYEQEPDGRWTPRLTPGTNTYNLTTGDNPRYIVNGHIWPGQRIFAVIRDL